MAREQAPSTSGLNSSDWSAHSAPAAEDAVQDIGLPARRQKGHGAGTVGKSGKLGPLDDIILDSLYRYPVKGLSPQPLNSVHLEPGETIPYDRAWAIENGPGRFDPLAPEHLPKTAFFMLMRDERLAALETHFDEDAQTLAIFRSGQQVCQGNLSQQAGRALIAQFFAAYMKDSLRGPPKVVSAPGHSFSDVAAKCLHIVNLASLAELEKAAGRKFNPIRFRPNIIIKGAKPWAEFDWLGKELRVGSNGVRLQVMERVVRCAATNVDPVTAARDADVPAILRRQWGHTDFGIYASVSERGTLAPGDVITFD